MRKCSIDFYDIPFCNIRRICFWRIFSRKELLFPISYFYWFGWKWIHWFPIYFLIVLYFVCSSYLISLDCVQPKLFVTSSKFPNKNSASKKDGLTGRQKILLFTRYCARLDRWNVVRLNAFSKITQNFLYNILPDYLFI